MMLSRGARTIDTLLDRSVVLGYTRIGLTIRQRWWGPDPEPGALSGEHVLITGASSGIGMAAAAELGRLGAVVHILGRNSERLDQARATLQADVPGGHFELETCDISDLTSVRDFAGEFSQRVPELHAIAHNAGTMTPERTETADGHETSLATHVLGPFLLTDQLSGPLAAGGGRVVFMSSGGMYTQPLRDDDLEYRRDTYSGAKAYARTKRMQVVLAKMWAEHLARDRVAVHSMHPGWVDTAGVARFLPKFRAITLPFMRSAAQGADTLVWLIAGPDQFEHTGSFWHDRRPRPTSYGRSRNETPSQRARLWNYCQDATGTSV